MVWVMCELAVRPDSQAIIHEEIARLTQDGVSGGIPAELTSNLLAKASFTDSFIREVMRMKGDTLGTVRMTTKETLLAGYVIPKG